ncbi:MAG TPA: TolC family protein [Candidatus Acidoferrales bacterium]|nr:TolC family protein [Candidatus Acidoferrales bacterium]
MKFRIRLSRVWLTLVLLCPGAALSFAQTAIVSSAGVPGQAIPGTQGVEPFAGSVPSPLLPGRVPISLQDALDRGLKQNLGLLLSHADIGAARGERWQQLSALLPQVAMAPYISASRLNFYELGFLTAPVPALTYSYFDSRLYISQSLFDWKAINNTRAAGQNVASKEFTYRDARDLVVLAVGYTYLQVIAADARVDTARAQVKTAQSIYDQAADQVKAGTSPAIDALRAKVELQTRQQQLIQTVNDLAIRKLTVARVIGLAPGQDFELTDKSLYQSFAPMTVQEALQRAYAARSDYRAAEADVRAAELFRKAAAAGYLPSLSFDANYGAASLHPSTATSVYDVRGTLTLPIFLGGRVHGDVLQADARLEQSRKRLENLRAQIDAEVRTALLNLQSSAEQVTVALSNIDLADQTLTQSTDRFSAGVTDSVEVVQSQEAVASAHEQYISSLYSYNYSKIFLARTLGLGEEGVKEFFKGK